MRVGPNSLDATLRLRTVTVVDDAERSRDMEDRLAVKVRAALSAALRDPDVTPVLVDQFDLGTQPPARTVERVYEASTADAAGIRSATVSATVSRVPSGPMTFSLSPATTVDVPNPMLPPGAVS